MPSFLNDSHRKDMAGSNGSNVWDLVSDSLSSNTPVKSVSQKCGRVTSCLVIDLLWRLALQQLQFPAWLETSPGAANWLVPCFPYLSQSQLVFCSLESSWILFAVFSFSSRISLNFFMFSKKSGLLCRVMKSFAFLLSPRLFEACTVMVSVRISLKVAYLFL